MEFQLHRFPIFREDTSGGESMSRKVELGSVATIVSGSTPSTSIEKYWGGGIPWITPAELNEKSFIVMSTERTLSDEGAAAAHLTMMPPETVLLSSRAPIGKVAIAGIPMTCNQGFKNLICRDCLEPRYLYWFLKSKGHYLNSLGRGATFKELSKIIVEKILIPVPAPSEQRRIASLFQEIAISAAMHQKQIEKLNSLVKSQFVEMFGDTRFNDKGFPVVRWKEIL